MICLLPNCCFLSETSRTLEIAGALARRGVPFRIATHGGPYEHLLAGHGYDVIGPGVSPERAAELVRNVPGIGPGDMWSEEELTGYAQLEAGYFREHGVSVVVTGWELSVLLSSRLAGIPVVAEHSGSMLPPLFERGMLPAPMRALGIPGEETMPEQVLRQLYNAHVHTVRRHTGSLQRAAGTLGVEGIPSLPAMLLGDLTLVTDVPEVVGIPRAEIDAWQPRHPEAYRTGVRLAYTGPLFARLDVPVPPEVESFLAAPGPVVYVAMTSTGPGPVREVVEHLAGVPARILVAGTVHDPAALLPPGRDDVLVAGVLPSHLVMPRVDAAVITGGQGSVQTAVASGLPFAGVPLQPEQDVNVALVERQGAALRVPARPSPELAAVPGLVARLLAEPSFRREARRLQAAYAAVDGPDEAARAIMALAAAGVPG